MNYTDEQLKVFGAKLLQTEQVTVEPFVRVLMVGESIVFNPQIELLFAESINVLCSDVGVLTIVQFGTVTTEVVTSGIMTVESLFVEEVSGLSNNTVSVVGRKIVKF